MTLTNLGKAPFPWFGGKSKAAPLVWRLLGDCPHYVEPFAGALGVLLNRPHPANRPYCSETINDLDGLVVNAWRSIQWHPEATADAASWPVTEADKSARQIAVLRWRTDATLERLAGDATFCDPQMAGWWLYGVCCQIGAFSGDGPWTCDPVSGRITKQPPGPLREPGVSRGLPHLGNDGRGVNRPQLREPGVGADPEFHPVTMPELTRWFQWLSARLRHVRIVNGDWKRVVTSGAAHTLPVRQGHGPAAVFLDPPYDSGERAKGLYAHDSGHVAAQCRDWAITVGDNPLWRIVLAGYDDEHTDEMAAAGWTEHEWFTAGYLSGGMGNVNQADGETHQQHRERLWASPHCVPLTAPEPDQGVLTMVTPGVVQKNVQWAYRADTIEACLFWVQFGPPLRTLEPASVTIEVKPVWVHESGAVAHPAFGIMTAEDAPMKMMHVVIVGGTVRR